MSIRSEREKSKMQEKYQLILAQMLKEDDNRFCVDCDTKSPRWASWNLGLFICIRCAGFHRNLGVHISKVKSVNLDSWTAEQIASMQAMGNNRARAVYEANLPAEFRRPQADSALESFIRAKYEQRKWIAKEWIPPEITVSSDLIESETNQRRVETTPEAGPVEKNVNNNNSIPKLKPFAAPVSNQNPVRQANQDRPSAVVKLPMPSSPSTTPLSNAPPPPAVAQASPNLLSLDEPSVPSPTLFSNSVTSSTRAPITDSIDPLHEVFSSPTINVGTQPKTTFESELQSAFTSSNETSTSTNTSGVMTNDKIMALFNRPQTTATAAAAPPPSGGNIRPITMQAPHLVHGSGFAHPQQHLHSHHKSASFGSNLHQQATNSTFQTGFQSQQGHLIPPTLGMGTMHHNNLSTPALQTPPSAFTNDQLNQQFSQFVPFANSKSNTSASTLISGMPTRPVTDYMPASSDLLWQ